MEDAKTIGLPREAWGPRFWKILHTLAECSGSYTNTILNNDEIDAWCILLKSQYYVMPCALCQQHYGKWLLSHKLDELKKTPVTERRNAIRTWLWACHSAVNTTNEKPSPSLEEMAVMYPKQSIEKEIVELNSMFQIALNKRKLKLDDIGRWKLVIRRLRSMYGL
jgi:hypothetical protein